MSKELLRCPECEHNRNIQVNAGGRAECFLPICWSAKLIHGVMEIEPSWCPKVKDARIAELEAAIMKISGIIKREDFGATPWVKNFQELGTAIGEAEKLVGAGR